MSPNDPETVSYRDRKITNEEFFVVTNPGYVKRWREDKTIPLVNVVQSFDIYQVHGGQAGVASKQLLRDVFGTSNETEAIEWLLQNGNIQALTDKIPVAPKQMPGRGKDVSNWQQPRMDLLTTWDPLSFLMINFDCICRCTRLRTGISTDD
ncbi:hypothetical protein BKA69DRAFT_1042493 [Paraphysoderma sedebokerense]|nr:hypothetical protein BKA69DRAFT_1042493 [Paraphysoderma sedebokerense]